MSFSAPHIRAKLVSPAQPCPKPKGAPIQSQRVTPQLKQQVGGLVYLGTTALVTAPLTTISPECADELERLHRGHGSFCTTLGPLAFARRLRCGTRRVRAV